MLGAAHTLSLTAISLVVSVAMLWAFGKCSDQAAIREAKRKIHAHLLAFRLYADEPAQIFRAQGQLLLWNLRYLALMLRPTAVTILPLALLLFHLDGLYGRRALHAGESAIVTAQFAQAVDANASLSGSGVAVETPALRIPAERRVLWRVRAVSDTPGTLSVQLPGGAQRKSVQAGSALSYISERRVASLPAWVLYPGEAPLAGGPLESISVEYPAADVSVLGFGVHWLVWFCVVSLAGMLVLRKRLNVTF